MHSVSIGVIDYEVRNLDVCGAGERGGGVGSGGSGGGGLCRSKRIMAIASTVTVVTAFSLSSANRPPHAS